MSVVPAPPARRTLPVVALPPDPRKHTTASRDVDRMYLSADFDGTEMHLGLMTKVDIERDCGARLTADEARGPKAGGLIATRLLANAQAYEDERRDADGVRALFVDAARRHAGTLHALATRALRDYDAQPGPRWTRDRARAAERVAYDLGQGIRLEATRAVLRAGGDTICSVLTRGERTSAPFSLPLARWRADRADHQRARTWDDAAPVARDPLERWKQWLYAMAGDLRGTAVDLWSEQEGLRLYAARALFETLLVRGQIGKDTTRWSPFIRGAVSLGGAGGVHQYRATLTQDAGGGEAHPAAWEGVLAPLGASAYDAGAFHFRFDPRGVGWPLDALRLEALVERAEHGAYARARASTGFPRDAAADLFRLAATPPDATPAADRR